MKKYRPLKIYQKDGKFYIRVNGVFFEITRNQAYDLQFTSAKKKTPNLLLNKIMFDYVSKLPKMFQAKPSKRIIAPPRFSKQANPQISKQIEQIQHNITSDIVIEKQLLRDAFKNYNSTKDVDLLQKQLQDARIRAEQKQLGSLTEKIRFAQDALEGGLEKSRRVLASKLEQDQNEMRRMLALMQQREDDKNALEKQLDKLIGQQAGLTRLAQEQQKQQQKRADLREQKTAQITDKMRQALEQQKEDIQNQLRAENAEKQKIENLVQQTVKDFPSQQDIYKMTVNQFREYVRNTGVNHIFGQTFTDFVNRKLESSKLMDQLKNAAEDPKLPVPDAAKKDKTNDPSIYTLILKKRQLEQNLQQQKQRLFDLGQQLQPREREEQFGSLQIQEKKLSKSPQRDVVSQPQLSKKSSFSQMTEDISEQIDRISKKFSSLHPPSVQFEFGAIPEMSERLETESQKDDVIDIASMQPLQEDIDDDGLPDFVNVYNGEGLRLELPSMTNIDFNRIFRGIQGYGGVFNLDQISDLLDEVDADISYQFFILNPYHMDHLQAKPGHWQVIMLDNQQKQICFFDSLGNRDIPEKIQAILDAILDKVQSPFFYRVKYNQNQLQLEDNNLCGYFCVLFIALYIDSRNFKYSTMFNGDKKTLQQRVQFIFK